MDPIIVNILDLAAQAGVDLASSDRITSASCESPALFLVVARGPRVEALKRATVRMLEEEGEPSPIEASLRARIAELEAALEGRAITTDLTELDTPRITFGAGAAGALGATLNQLAGCFVEVDGADYWIVGANSHILRVRRCDDGRPYGEPIDLDPADIDHVHVY